MLRTRFRYGACLSACFGLAGAAAAQLDANAGQIVRVDEEWEAVLTLPDADLNSPQFHTVMTPFGDTEPLHFQTCWNYREQPDFQSGGLQILAYRFDDLAGHKSFRDDLLSSSAESVTWTQSMRVSGSTLIFMVDNGSSNTWGAFGGAESRLTGLTPAPDFSMYSPDVSRDNSWISYGSNRVQLLRIVRVRYYDTKGDLVQVDETPRVVHQAGLND